MQKNGGEGEYSLGMSSSEHTLNLIDVLRPICLTELLQLFILMDAPEVSAITLVTLAVDTTQRPY